MSKSNQNSPEYNKIKKVGSWSTWLIWLQILLLPLLILLPYLMNQKTITLKTFLAIAAVNVALTVPLIIILVVKGEPLKHPENLPLQQIRRDINWVTWATLVVLVVSFLDGGRIGLLWLLFIFAISRGMQTVKALEKNGVQYIKQ